MTAIDTTDLTKRYETTLAVDTLSLTIPNGTIYGFLGPNGGGKTTTMRMLTGLTRPISGSGTVATVSITDRDGLRPHINDAYRVCPDRVLDGDGPLRARFEEIVN